MTAEASENIANWCEQEWLTQSAMFADKQPPDYNGLLERWQLYSNKCQGTVTYEARLAFVYYLLNQPEKAKIALQPIEYKKSEFAYLVEIAKTLIETAELPLSSSANVANLQDIEAKLRKLMEQHPDHIEIYGLLGGIETLLDHHEQAIQTLESALKFGNPFNSKAGVYRNLTINYAEIGRYQEAYEAAGNAIGLQKKVMDDQYFVYAVAKAEADLNRFEDAQTALRVIASKKPEVKSTAEFRSAVSFVFEKMKKSGSDKK